MGEIERLTSVSLDQLREKNTTRAAKWNKGNPGPLSFAMMELAGECGEACNAAKKMARHEMGWVGGSPDSTNLAEELGDVVICADLAAMHAGIDLAKAVADKFNKTSEKHGFPERIVPQDSELAALRAENAELRKRAEGLAKASKDLCDLLDGFDERDLLRLDGDPHPPSSTSVQVGILRSVIAAGWLEVKA